MQAAGYMEQPLRVEMLGSFNGFYDFLLGLENLPRITRIKELALERQSGGRDEMDGAMKATFTLTIYFEPTTLDTSSP